MASYVSRNDIILATIRCVRREGLAAVTMRVIGREVGILGQGLYNHFPGKDAVLDACCRHCETGLASAFAGFSFDEGDNLPAAVKKLWLRYFGYFAGHPEENSFYRQYRESVQFQHTPELKTEEDALLPVRQLLDELERRYDPFRQANRSLLLAHVQFITPVFAQMLSDGKLPDTPETREQLWQTIAGGLGCMWNEKGGAAL